MACQRKQNGLHWGPSNASHLIMISGKAAIPRKPFQMATPKETSVFNPNESVFSIKIGRIGVLGGFRQSQIYEMRKGEPLFH